MAEIQSITKRFQQKTPKKESVKSADHLIGRVGYLHIPAARIKEATGHLQELATMLFEAQDCRDRDLDIFSIVQGVEGLVDCYASYIDKIADDLVKLSKEAFALKKQNAQ